MHDRSTIEQAIITLEIQRPILGDAVVDASLAALRQQLTVMRSPAAQEHTRKLATILFADLSGFTALSESLDAEEITEMMNALWQRLDEVIVAFGGRIDKHIGDAVMAIWGTPTAREDDPERAVRAALGMQAALWVIRAETGIDLHMRIGINTGPVVIGTVGASQEWTAIGDAVNLASRMEHAAPVDGILIAHDTYRHVHGLFNIAVLPPIQVKGKRELVAIYRINYANPRTFALPQRGIEATETAMIGRDAELAQLQSALARAQAGHSLQVLTIIGDAGMGKSRLVYEYRSWVEQQSNPVKLLCGRVTPESQQTPYALLRDVLAFCFKLNDSDSRSVAYEKLQQGILAMIGSVLGQEIVHEHAQTIAQVVGLVDTTGPADLLRDPSHGRRQVLRALTAVIAAFSTHNPVLIILEDIHWADESSLDLFRELEGQCAQVPVVMVYLTRPILFERQPTWGCHQAPHVKIALAALTLSAAAQLTNDMLRYVDQISPALRSFVVTRAEGNPFYVKELIKMLIDQQVILPGPAIWTVDDTRLVESQIPSTLIGVLQARLDSLPAMERHLLQRASIMGREFWDQALCDHPDQAAMVRRGLLSACDRELIYPTEVSTFALADEYHFKHALLRDVAYASVLKRQRRMYHASAAAWLIQMSGDRAPAYASLIAHHYCQAEARDEAGRWYIQAGQHAQAIFASRAACNAFCQALDMLPTSEHPPILLRLGNVYQDMGNCPAAAECYQTALATDQIEPLLVACLQRDYGITLRHQSRYGESVDCLERAATAFTALGHDAELAYTLGQLGYVLVLERSHIQATQILHRAFAIAVTAADIPAQLSITNILGLNASYQEQHSEARHWVEQTLILSRTVGHTQMMTRSICNLGSIALNERAYAQGTQHTIHALDLFRELEDRWGEANCLHNLVILAYFEEHFDEAEGYYLQSATLQDELGDMRARCMGHYNAALLAFARGNYVISRSHLDRALTMEYVELDSLLRVSIQICLGFLSMAERDDHHAGTYFMHSLRFLRSTDACSDGWDGLLGVAMLLSRQGTRPNAIASVSLLAAGDPWAGKHTQYVYGFVMYQTTLSTNQHQLDSGTFKEAWNAGKQLSYTAALDLAIAFTTQS
ncbi:MAG: AAA family ATPase [Herpetosiphonaceae bacterium]|nr:AAA family ATPase [Herpetosiphonaceae bacterium]